MHLSPAAPHARRPHIASCGLALVASLLFAAPTQGMPREVRVGVYQNEPKIFMSPRDQPTGILGDLLVEIGKREGWVLRAVPCEWQACLNALQAGDIDLMPDVAYTEQRARLFDMHRIPSLLSWSQLYKHGGGQINSMLDLKGKRVAVLAGSVQQDYLKGVLTGFGVQAELVAARAADAVAANRFFGDLQGATYGLNATPIMFQPSQLFYATGKGRNADLLTAIDRSLGEWQPQPDSPYFQVLKRWMEVRAPSSFPVYVWWGLGALVALLALALAAGALLRREVAVKTRHLRASEDTLATILNSVDAYIYIKGPDFCYQYANRKVCDLFGRPLAEVVGKADNEFFDDATAAKLRINDMRVLVQGERVEEEEINQSRDGSQTQTYISVKLPLRHADGRIYALCGISTDISKQKKAEAAIHQLAFYDPLTQLPNRRFLMEQVQQTLAASERGKQGGAMLFIDVDNFKDLNDTVGHDMGDQLLCQVAARLRACTRAQDTLARLGGDEFVVMLQTLSPRPDEAAQQARNAAAKILQTIAEPYQLGTQLHQTSVSIGIAMFSDQHSSRDELLKQADLAMYQAKTDGRNTLRFFNPDMQAQVTARTALEADLHRAMAASEFLLYYQPQVNANGLWLGVEALVRWQHPQRGLVPPHLSIAVNVSARQFHQADFVQDVQQALRASGANPQRLALELTESQLLDDVDSVVVKMTALKAMGVRFSLDDFGTGYSSLSMLKRLPLDQLKIDQSFVRDVLTDPQDASIIKAIVTLGASLELQVIAEGVETMAQRDALMALGCQKFQGYLFGRPAPADPAPADDELHSITEG